MLTENPDMQRKLRAAAKRLGRHLSLDDDLYQEMLLHLWQAETRNPGREQAWYLNGCIFYARNYLRQGKSIDSNGRRGRRAAGVDIYAIAAPAPVAEYTYESRFASEFLNMLSEKLTGAKRRILGLMAKGHTVGEVAQELGVSHQAVSKHFKAIKVKAERLQAVSQSV